MQVRPFSTACTATARRRSWRARARAGARALDGAGMLVAQAVATMRIVGDIARLEGVPDEAELFSIMARAAGFDLPV